MIDVTLGIRKGNEEIAEFKIGSFVGEISFPTGDLTESM